MLAWMFGCGGVTGLPRIDDVDLIKTYPYVQVLPNSDFSPECNVASCAVLFTTGGAELYVPRVSTLGPGRPADFDLSSLRPYRVSDGSLLFAPLGSVPTEYRTESGQIRIQFGVFPGRSQRSRFTGFDRF